MGVAGKTVWAAGVFWAFPGRGFGVSYNLGTKALQFPGPAPRSIGVPNKRKASET